MKSKKIRRGVRLLGALLLLGQLLGCGYAADYAYEVSVIPVVAAGREGSGEGGWMRLSSSAQGKDAPRTAPVATPAAISDTAVVSAEKVEKEVSAEGEKSGPYTIAWMSDTQRYSSSYPETFLAMTGYLKRAQEALNLGYVVLTGDLVGTAGSSKQWENARRAMDELADIPHGVLAGNHDRNKNIGYANFSKYFGEAYYQDKPYYGGSYADNRNHYDLITLGKTDYLFVYLGYQPTKKGMDWANRVFARYPERVGILCVHDYLNSESKLRDMGKTLQKEVVAANPNVYMVLCGHRYAEDMVPARFDDDGDGRKERTVYQCIANYQKLEEGGRGYIRFLRVDEEKGEIRFYTYSPLLDEYRAPPAKAVTQRTTLPIPWEIPVSDAE